MMQQLNEFKEGSCYRVAIIGYCVIFVWFILMLLIKVPVICPSPFLWIHNFPSVPMEGYFIGLPELPSSFLRPILAITLAVLFFLRFTWRYGKDEALTIERQEGLYFPWLEYTVYTDQETAGKFISQGDFRNNQGLPVAGYRSFNVHPVISF